MQQERESFLFYKEWFDATKELPDGVRLEIYEAIIVYGISGEIKELKPIAKVAFNFVKGAIDRNNDKYFSFIDKQKENGTKGGRPKKSETQNNPKNPSLFLETQNNPKNPTVNLKTQKSLNVNDNVNVNDNSNELLKKNTAKKILGVGSEFEKTENNQIRNYVGEEKEKSCVKKENHSGLVETNFFKKVSEFFKQTTEVLKMRMATDIRQIENKGFLRDFEKQTVCYIEFKEITHEKAHRWQNYLREWRDEDWEEKLNQEKQKENGNDNNPNNPKIGRSKLSELENLHAQITGR